jgi:hypothetical protein
LLRSYKSYTLRLSLLEPHKPYPLDSEGNYGITQNPDTKVYILVFSNEYFKHYCKCGNSLILCEVTKCSKNNFINRTSGNKNIDDFIQKKQLIYSVFEWIPYNGLICIKEIGDNCLTTAIWKGDPLYYKNKHRISEKVTLRFLRDLQNVPHEFINKVLNYFSVYLIKILLCAVLIFYCIFVD